MDFIEYLIKKNIHPDNFKTKEPQLFSEWEIAFSVMSENSFTLQKKFSINKIRRKYPNSTEF